MIRTGPSRDAVELEEQGADIIDIGAESTRPGAARISEAEELRRLVPGAEAAEEQADRADFGGYLQIRCRGKGAGTGRGYFERSQSALTFDPDMARAAVHGNAGLILNHMRGTPETWAKLPPLKDVIRTIARELDASVHRAVIGGVDRKRIVIDPGLGIRKAQRAERGSAGAA